MTNEDDNLAGFFDRKKAQSDVMHLKKELKDFYKDRLSALHKDVTDYFQKYWNVEVKEEYLRLLSSSE